VKLGATYAGTATPFLRGYSFDPPSRSYASAGSKTAEDFKAAAKDLSRGEIVSPPNGSTLGSVTVMLQWAPGDCVSQYYLFVGTTPGGSETLSEDQSLSLARVVSGLPTDGSSIYVRLWSAIAGTWYYNDYVYTAAKAATTAPSEIIKPSGGTALKSSTATFNWTPGIGVSQFYLMVGQSPGGSAIYANDLELALSTTVNGLPADGSTVYVRLYSKIGPDWHYNDYTYTAASAPGAGKAELTFPPNGGRFCSASAALQWSPGNGVSRYWLSVGTSFGVADILNQDQTPNLYTYVSGLPVNGKPVYVRLWSNINGAWYPNDYTLFAASGP
jgi:hypothetical protein